MRVRSGFDYPGELRMGYRIKGLMVRAPCRVGLRTGVGLRVRVRIRVRVRTPFPVDGAARVVQERVVLGRTDEARLQALGDGG